MVDELCRMYREGEFTHSEPEKVKEDKALRDYCGSVLSNWLRKDPRLGGSEPEASKEGRKKPKPADDEMKRLMKAKVLLKANGQPTDEIDTLIKQRDDALSNEKEAARAEAVSDAEALLAAIENK